MFWIFQFVSGFCPNFPRLLGPIRKNPDTRSPRNAAAPPKFEKKTIYFEFLRNLLNFPELSKLSKVIRSDSKESGHQESRKRSRTTEIRKKQTIKNRGPAGRAASRPAGRLGRPAGRAGEGDFDSADFSREQLSDPLCITPILDLTMHPWVP